MGRKKDIERIEASFGSRKEDDFNFELIEKYSKNKKNKDVLQYLSDKTCNDLDFNELFMFIDRTTSKVGQQTLYNQLRSIPKNSNTDELDEEIIQELTQDSELRIRSQLLLDRLSKFDVYYISSLFQDEHQKPPKWFFMVPLLSFTSLLSLIMMPFNPGLFFVFLAVFIVNLVIHYLNKNSLIQYLGSLPQLLILNNVATKLYKISIYQKTKPNLSKSIKTINKIRNRMSFFRLEAQLQGDFEAIFWTVLELFKIAFLLEPLLLFGILKRLDAKREELEEVFCFVGKIDSLISILSLRKGLDNYCLPEKNSKRISARQLYHPLITDCVRNDISVDNKSILITGSNMSGKTSFIRTIGLNIITGLTINTCFAESICIPRSRIYSAIRISDDLINDKSYYFAEVLAIKEMIEKSTKSVQNLFLLDEIFKGTNTVERISAGKAVLSFLANENNIVFVSTHDIELTDLLENEYELYHFSEIVDGKNVDFDYKIKAGKLKNRNAIRILEINGYPHEIIREAMNISEGLDHLTKDQQ